jgi:hypothetical protein
MARDLAWLAVLWHVALLSGAGLLATRQGASSPPAAMLWLTLPSLSVSVAAFDYGLPFNGVAFGVLGLAFATLGIMSKPPPLHLGPTWARVLGAALLVFGWVYPHFNSGPWARVLYAAPLGVLPCPTLAVLAGAVLFADGLGSRAVCSLLAAWCAFYAAFGMFRLDVVIDLGLVFAAVGLIVIAVRRHPREDVRRQRNERPARYRAGLSGRA